MKYLNPAEGRHGFPTFQDPSGMQAIGAFGAGVTGFGEIPGAPVGPIGIFSGQGFGGGGGVPPIRAQPIPAPRIPPIRLQPVGHPVREIPPFRAQPVIPIERVPPARQPGSPPPSGTITTTPAPRIFEPGQSGGGPTPTVPPGSSITTTPVGRIFVPGQFGTEPLPVPPPPRFDGIGRPIPERFETPVRQPTGEVTPAETLTIQADPPPGIAPALLGHCPHCGGETESPWMGHATHPGELGWHENGAPVIRLGDGTLAPSTCSTCPQ